MNTIGNTYYNVSLYLAPSIREENNQAIDEVDEYLSTLEVQNFPNLPPFTPTLDLTIRLPLNDIEAIGKTGYYFKAKAFQTGESGTPLAIKTYYYFVREIVRLSNGACELTLHMDVLNTYPLVAGTLTAKTMIKREHKDRFYTKTLSGWPRSGVFAKRFDQISEGLTPRKIVASEGTISQDEAPSQNFYLLYKTAQELSATNLSNPVSCFLSADDEILKIIGVSGSVMTWEYSAFVVGDYYAFLKSDYIFIVTIKSIYRTTGVATIKATYSSDDLDMIILNATRNAQGSENRIVAHEISANENAQTFFDDDTSSYIVVELTLCKGYRVGFTLSSQENYYLNYPLNVLNSGVQADTKTSAFSAVNRTDSKFLKIIKLPYCPVPFSHNTNGEYSFEGFSYTTSDNLRIFKLNSLDTDFLAHVTDYNLSDILRQSLTLVTKEASLKQARYVNDPKLFHSDFFLLKFNYDSFSVALSLELTSYTEPTTDPKIGIDFKATNTINSNFSFRLTANNFSWKLEQDYGNFILSTRNNEMTIFSNSYIDYIRTGYNFDKKSKAVSATTSWISTAASIGGGIAGAVLGKDPVTKATSVGLAISGFAQLASTIGGTINNEVSLADKLAELKQQSTNTAGADDIDLLSFYGDNKLRVSKWYVTPDIAAMLDDLFYYCGYNCGHQDTPNTNSRAWFNFLQCTPVYSDSYIGSSTKEVLDEVTAKLENGVTFYHANSVEGNQLWDFDQTHENYEAWLIA